MIFLNGCNETFRSIGNLWLTSSCDYVDSLIRPLEANPTVLSLANCLFAYNADTTTDALNSIAESRLHSQYDNYTFGTAEPYTSVTYPKIGAKGNANK